MVYAALLVILVAIAGFAYHHHSQAAKQEQAYQADKATFAKVETDMKAAYDAIVAQVGKPDVAHTNVKSCGYTARKFEKGDLRCGDDYNLGYLSLSYPIAFDHLATMQGLILKGGSFSVASGSTDISKLDREDPRDPVVEVGLMGPEQTSCSISLRYLSAKSFPELYASKDGWIAAYDFSCTRDVGRPIYPLAQ